MRILHVIRGLNPSFGGPPRVAVRLAAGQATLGHDVTIVTYRLADPPEALRGMTRLLPNFDRVRIIEIENGGAVEALLLGALRAGPILERLIAEADFVHLHDVWDAIIRVAAVQARRAGKPYVIQPNDSLNPWSLSQKRLKKDLGLTLGYRRIIEGSAAILFGHDEEKRLVRDSSGVFRTFVAARSWCS